MEQPDWEARPPTPNVDDTPYIRFAIEQLTRDQDVAPLQRPSATTSEEDYPVDRVIPDMGLGYISEHRFTREELALARKHRSSPDHARLFRFNPTKPLSIRSNPSILPPKVNVASSSAIFMPVSIPPHHSTVYPALRFKPTILRPLSMITLSILCLLMIATLVFCAIYSTSHAGLDEWAGNTGGRYFVFGFLPQLFAAGILLYVQCVMTAVTRIVPFTMLAADDTKSRTNALFLGLYPRSLLFPRWEVGRPFAINVAITLLWLTIFTIPLQSCLFSVSLFAGKWRWSAVMSVAWTLVTIYLLVLIGTAILGLWFFRRTTGLKWDPRSLADLIALLPRSNALRDYTGTEVLGTKQEIEERLAQRSDRLGYWEIKARGSQPFYGLGETGATTRRYTLEGEKVQVKAHAIVEDVSDRGKSALLRDRTTRFRHIPWQLSDTFVIFWILTAFILLLALLVVSFLPTTAIRNGFPPLVSSAPNPEGFSPSNFLYSFVPATMGMLLYLAFLPLDMALRTLAPWSAMGPQGATAKQSLLLDYPFRLPLECTIAAAKNSHYRIATISLLSPLFLLLPILAGGLFFPLQTTEGIRMLPNLPAFYLLLVLLFFYVGGLVLLLSGRAAMRMPHGTSCLAEIFSFFYNSCVLDDAAFSAVVSKEDLVRRLTAVRTVRWQAGGATGRGEGKEARYVFGVFRGRNERCSLGVEKLGRRGEEVLVWGV